MIKSKKSLGQNFLTNTTIVSSIADEGNITPNETILEIGPGKGVLTEELLKRGAKVIAIEKDTELLPYLEGKFSKALSEKRLTLIQGDILNYEVLFEEKYKVIANIPYYITGLIIRKFLSEQIQPERMVLLVQKEVAERIVAQNKKESLLSISIKIYGTPKYIKTVKAVNFNPIPKVDSAILLIENISRNFLGSVSEKRFFEVLHAGFSHKRKQLFGNLKAVFEEKALKIKMESAHILQNTRAESLSKENWLELSK